MNVPINNPTQRKVTENFLHKYQPDLTVDSYTSDGLLIEDRRGRKVGVIGSEMRGQWLHTPRPYADVMVIGAENGLLLGWVHAEKMMDAKDRCLVKVKSLNKLPQKLDFATECPHMSVYGGIYDNEEDCWRCCNCEQAIVF